MANELEQQLMAAFKRMDEKEKAKHTPGPRCKTHNREDCKLGLCALNHEPVPAPVPPTSKGRRSDYEAVQQGRIAELSAQQDELLAALEQIANHVTKSDTWELKRIARAAIARAKGEKS